MKKKTIINIVLAVAMVAIFVVSFVVGGLHQANPDERFGGTDDKATSVIQQLDPGYVPWFSSLFEPASGEVESGLFAMQAAIGGVVLGFALGALWGRRKRATVSAATDPGSTATDPAA